MNPDCTTKTTSISWSKLPADGMDVNRYFQASSASRPVGCVFKNYDVL